MSDERTQFLLDLADVIAVLEQVDITEEVLATKPGPHTVTREVLDSLSLDEWRELKALVTLTRGLVAREQVATRRPQSVELM